jgi:hypothetical protein
VRCGIWIRREILTEKERRRGGNEETENKRTTRRRTVAEGVRGLSEEMVERRQHNMQQRKEEISFSRFVQKY